MNRIIATVSTMLIIVGFASAKDLATYKATYEKEMEAIILSHGMNMTEVSQHYTKALDSLLSKVKEDGDLDKTTAVMEEIARFSKDEAVPEKTSPLLDIQKIQSAILKQTSVYEAAKAKNIALLAIRYDRALERLQESLVSSDQLAEARAVQKERREVMASETVVAAKALCLDIKKEAEQQQTAQTQNIMPVAKQEKNTYPEGTFTQFDHHYFFITERMDWKSGKAECEELGGHLLSIDEKKEYEHFWNLATEQGKHIWLDMNDLEKEGRWRNWQGKRPRYLKWSKKGNDPNGGFGENVGIISPNWGGICDWNHNHAHYVICEWDK